MRQRCRIRNTILARFDCAMALDPVPERPPSWIRLGTRPTVRPGDLQSDIAKKLVARGKAEGRAERGTRCGVLQSWVPRTSCSR